MSVKVYRVGGSVRDQLLGLPVNDEDFVVVGATAADMDAAGYKLVGNDFPVYLHPVTGDEYALARKERKTGPGYTGFEVTFDDTVTLKEDLFRRDITINAMAVDIETGELHDLFYGRDDLRNGIIRHVSEAFSEDPVRILRAARFAARFDFWIAPETMHLMQVMVENGEVDALVPERVWQEVAKALMEKTPSRFFTTLRECGALAKILPEVDALFGVPQPEQHHPEVDSGVHTMMVLDDAAKHGYSLEVRFAALTHDLGKATTPVEILPRHHDHETRSFELVGPLCKRLCVPTDCKELALLVAKFHSKVHQVHTLKASTLVDLLHHTDALRRGDRFVKLLEACASDSRGRLGFADVDYPSVRFAQEALALAKSVDAGAIAMACSDKKLIAERVRAARIKAVKTMK
jgi:tRNA nucleotidyltransferase (CCA-adding enzyme)